jgi:hypothetical protein
MMNDAYISMNDRDLLAAARVGDAAALEVLVARYGSLVVQTLAGTAGSCHPVEVWLRLLALPRQAIEQADVRTTLRRLCGAVE